MSLLAFALVLAAACCHATWNVLVKRLNGGPELVWLFSAIAVLIYLPVTVCILLTDMPVFGSWMPVVIGGSAILHLGYFLLLQQGYRRGDLSLVYPTARATGPLLSTGFAVVFLDERLTARIAVGGAVVILAVLCLTGGVKSDRKKASASLLFGLGAGLLIGGYTVWDAYAVSALMVSPLLLDYGSSLGRSLMLLPYAMRRKPLLARHWRDHRLGVIAIAIFNPLAYILVLYALTFTPVVYVAPTREMSVLITVLSGSILLGEGDLRRRLSWAALMLIGIVVLTSAPLQRG